MKRDPVELASREFDVLVIGGGIYGVCISWEAASRGLSVALIEKADFGGATSFNSLRVIHGGFRYLQYGDVQRVRQSIQERNTFLRIAPHLVHRLPVLIPAYGHGLRGKEVLAMAAAVNGLLASGRHGGQQLPWGQILTKQECLNLAPGMDGHNLTGAILVYDCQASSTERLVLAFCLSAAHRGAALANYVEATKLLIRDKRICGTEVLDRLSGEKFSIKAKMVVNACGPWVNSMLNPLRASLKPTSWPFSKAFNVLVNRELIPGCAAGVYGRHLSHTQGAVLNNASRVLFIVPWHNRSLIGTAHLAEGNHPDEFRVTRHEVDTFLDEINQAYHQAQLGWNDIDCVYGGLLPSTGYVNGRPQLLRHPCIYDHEKEEHVSGILTVVGVKFTEARRVAEKTVDTIFRKFGVTPPPSRTAVTPLHGACICEPDIFPASQIRKRSREISAEMLRILVSHYGSDCVQVLNYAAKEIEDGKANIDSGSAITAEVLYGIAEEMAEKLSDIVLRRTTLSIPGRLTEESLQLCAHTMARVLGWSDARRQQEISELRIVPNVPASRGRAAFSEPAGLQRHCNGRDDNGKL